MLTRIPAQITTLQSARLTNGPFAGAEGPSETEELLEGLTDEKLYDSDAPLRNSGAAPLFALQTDITLLPGTFIPGQPDNPLTARIEDVSSQPIPYIDGSVSFPSQWDSDNVLIQRENWVGLWAPRIERFNEVYDLPLDDSSYSASGSAPSPNSSDPDDRKIRLAFDWEEASLVFRCPSIITGPINPIILFVPVIKDLSEGLGRSDTLVDNDVRRSNSGRYSRDVPNWLWSSAGEPWQIPGAAGPEDVDWEEAWEMPLLRPGQSESREFHFDVPPNVLEGLLGGSYSGLRISLRYSDADVRRVFFEDSSVREQGVSTTEVPNGITQRTFSGHELQLSNLFSRTQLNSPSLEVRSLEHELDRSSAFILDREQLIGINFSRYARPSLPPELDDPDAEVQVLLEARIHLLYESFPIALNLQQEGSPIGLPSAEIDRRKGRLTANVQIDPDLLDQRVIDILGFQTEFDPSVVAEFFSPSELLPDGSPDYDNEAYWNFYNSEGNEKYRHDKPFVDVLGDVTLHEILSVGTDRFNIATSRSELNAHWVFVESGATIDPDNLGATGRVLGTSNLEPRDFDPFGAQVGTLVNDIYPRITTVGLRRSWSGDEPPQMIQVFVDDRPPQQMANATLRRTLTRRTSAVFEDLAWGVVQGSQQGEGRWIIEPSDATLLSHDGRYHWFIFDPDALPRGTWRFEFVRLNNGSRLRQINKVDFTLR